MFLQDSSEPEHGAAARPDEKYSSGKWRMQECDTRFVVSVTALDGDGEGVICIFRFSS